MKSIREDIILTSKVDNLKLGVTIVSPEEEPKAIVQLAHGMCEHKERYLEFMNYLASLGYVCIINDHRGHGLSVKSKDDLGYFYENGDGSIVEDLHQVTEFIKNKYEKKPVYLFGHSMGSLVVRAYIKKYDYEISGLIVCGSPSENIGSKFGTKIVSLMSLVKGNHFRSKFINKLSLGKFNSKIKGATCENEWICNDKKIVDEFNNDNLCGFIFTLNGFYSLFNLMNKVYSKKGWKLINKKLPIWFISGEEDPCMQNRDKFIKAVQLLRNVGYENVTYKLYKNMRHEILNEKEKFTVFNDIYNKLCEWERDA